MRHTRLAPQGAATIIRPPVPRRESAALFVRSWKSSCYVAVVKAIVATARKLAVLFWCMLTREQDYAHQQPSLTAQKLRRLEIAAGAPVRKGKPSGVWVTHQKMRRAEKQLAA